MVSEDLNDTVIGTMDVPEKDQLDRAALDQWMQAHVEGYAGPMDMSKFKGGQSNPTYRIDTPDRSYVLRRKPFGELLPSAHAVDREYKVIAGLHPTGFPVAKPYGLCTDDGVVGSMFYIMEMVQGRSLWDGTLPGMTQDERRDIYFALIDTLAELHQTDHEAAGLGDYGKPGNYFERQVGRWTKQYKAAQTDDLPEMDKLIAWLPQTLPSQERTSIVHGDYRIDNVIFAQSEARVAAVLDWELSTLGDPMADVAYLLMNWETESEGRAGLAGVDLESLGIPTMDEMIARYAQKTGRSSIPDLNWYFAFNMFRLAGIVQGIKKRMIDGTASSAHAKETVARMPDLVQSAWMFAQRAGAA